MRLTRSGITFLLIGFFLFCTAITLPARGDEPTWLTVFQTGKDKPPTTPVSALIRKNFDKWDTNKDGKLSHDEVDAAFNKMQFKGETAAALAVVKCWGRSYLDKDQTPPPYTLDMLLEYEAAKAKKKEVKQDFDNWFVEFKEKIAKTPRELFPEKVPKLSAIKQSDDMSDCFLLCMVGAFVHHHPQDMVRMIEPKNDGKQYIVNFPGTPKPIVIKAPTDAEVALNTSALGNGLWLTVVEKAYCARVNRKLPPGEKKKSASDVHGSHGGSSADTIAILTGHDCFGVGVDTPPKLLKTIQAGVATRCLMAAGIPKENKLPAGLIHGHVYAVIGFSKGNVTIFDPRGQNFKPNGPPNRTNGYVVTNGVFTLPFSDYIAVFHGIRCEDKAAKAKF